MMPHFPKVATVSSTKNPSIYGDSISFTISTAGARVMPTGAITIMLKIFS